MHLNMRSILKIGRCPHIQMTPFVGSRTRHPDSGRQEARSQVTGVVHASSTMQKNSVRQPRPENVKGEFYVDHTCIGKL
jgi:hypothetical protein